MHRPDRAGHACSLSTSSGKSPSNRGIQTHGCGIWRACGCRQTGRQVTPAALQRPLDSRAGHRKWVCALDTQHQRFFRPAWTAACNTLAQGTGIEKYIRPRADGTEGPSRRGCRSHGGLPLASLWLATEKRATNCVTNLCRSFVAPSPECDILHVIRGASWPATMQPYG